MFGEMRKYKLRTVTRILSAVSEPNRLRILATLSRRKMAVCEIREILGLSFSTVSKHLSILAAAGLIEFEKEGKWVHYRLTDSVQPEIRDLIDRIMVLLAGEPQIRKDLEKARSVDKLVICGLTKNQPKPIINSRRNKQ